MTAEHQDLVTMTVTEAARAVGVDRRTIRRRLDGGEFPHAYREAGRQGPRSGPWLIPVDDLVGAGLNLRDPSEIDGSDQGPSGRTEVDALRKALADAIRRAEVAEARAVERERVIEAQELALRSLANGASVDGDVVEPGADPGTPSGSIVSDGVPSHAVSSHAVSSHAVSSHAVSSHAVSPNGVASDGAVPDGAVSDGVASDRDDSDRDPAPPAPEPAAVGEGTGAPEAGPTEHSELAVGGDLTDPVPPVALPYPEATKRPTPTFSPGAPRKPTPPWVPIPLPPPRRRWWQRKP